jgi:hypothetical protein
MMSDMTREPRPRSATPEICREVAAQLHAALMRRAGLSYYSEPEEGIADIAFVLLRHDNSDGYQLARFLETSRSWVCDFQIAEVLEEASALLNDGVMAAQRAWAEKNLSPPLAIGTPIRLIESQETGVITGLCEDSPATYLVKIDGDANAAPPVNRRIEVFFEDLEPC